MDLIKDADPVTPQQFDDALNVLVGRAITSGIKADVVMRCLAMSVFDVGRWYERNQRALENVKAQQLVGKEIGTVDEKGNVIDLAEAVYKQSKDENGEPFKPDAPGIEGVLSAGKPPALVIKE